MEEIIFGIIIHAGNAKSKLHEAMSAAKEKDFDQVDALLKEADEALLEAHKVQTKLIQNEAAGEKTEVSILLVQAQDHLMNAMSEKNLIKEIIELRREFNK